MQQPQDDMDELSSDSGHTDGEEAVDDDNDAFNTLNVGEYITLHLEVHEDGTFSDLTQVQHYLYRSDVLAWLNFYDFVRCTRLEKEKFLSSEGRVKLPHYELLPPHLLCETHQIILHTDPDLYVPCCEIVPRVVGYTIPRKTAVEIYSKFVLSHFKPFSHSVPLLGVGETYNEMLETYASSERSISVMENWDAIHECEDERDAERLRKRSAATKAAAAMTSSIIKSLNTSEEGVVDDSSLYVNMSSSEIKFHTCILEFEQTGWFHSASQSHGELHHHDMSSSATMATTKNINTWSCIMKVLIRSIERS